MAMRHHLPGVRGRSTIAARPLRSAPDEGGARDRRRDRRTGPACGGRPGRGGCGKLGAADVVVLGERPAAAVPAIVRACDLLVLLVAGAGGRRAGRPRRRRGPTGGGRGGLRPRPLAMSPCWRWPTARSTRRPTAGWPGSPSSIRWPVAATSHRSSPAALAERRRCLLIPVTEPGPHDLANEPREGRTLDEVARR